MMNWLKLHWKDLLLKVLVPLLVMLAGGTTIYQMTRPAVDPERHTGWIVDPAAVQTVLDQLQRDQGFHALNQVANDLFAGDDDDAPVFFWEAEGKVLGQVLDSWSQGSAGTCVSFGWGRGAQDLLLIQIIQHHLEEWPGAQVATEPIYGGSRVEVGGGRLSGDGSTGAWAAQWVTKWGILLRQKYGDIDLSTYSTTRSREWGRTGVPNVLEPLAKEHPIGAAALVSSTKEAWAAIGSGYPIPVCSGVGFESPLKDGFCEPRGSWGHCMEVRGRFVHPTRGRCFVIQNSWGNYLAKYGEANRMLEVKGRNDKVKLPTGCFACTEAALQRILSERDSFAMSAAKGFPRRKLDWVVQGPRPLFQEKRDAAWVIDRRNRNGVRPEFAGWGR